MTDLRTVLRPIKYMTDLEVGQVSKSKFVKDYLYCFEWKKESYLIFLETTFKQVFFFFTSFIQQIIFVSTSYHTFFLKLPCPSKRWIMNARLVIERFVKWWEIFCMGLSEFFSHIEYLGKAFRKMEMKYLTTESKYASERIRNIFVVFETWEEYELLAVTNDNNTGLLYIFLTHR